MEDDDDGADPCCLGCLLLFVLCGCVLVSAGVLLWRLAGGA